MDPRDQAQVVRLSGENLHQAEPFHQLKALSDFLSSCLSLLNGWDYRLVPTGLFWSPYLCILLLYSGIGQLDPC